MQNMCLISYHYSISYFYFWKSTGIFSDTQYITYYTPTTHKDRVFRKKTCSHTCSLRHNTIVTTRDLHNSVPAYCLHRQRVKSQPTSVKDGQANAKIPYGLHPNLCQHRLYSPDSSGSHLHHHPLKKKMKHATSQSQPKFQRFCQENTQNRNISDCLCWPHIPLSN